MYISGSDNKEIGDDGVRLSSLAERLDLWSTGQGGAVHVLADGNYYVSYNKIRLQSMAGLFQNLSTFLASGSCLLKEGLDPEHWLAVQVHLSKIDAATERLFQQALLNCATQYQALKQEITSAKRFAQTLATCHLMSDAGQALRECLRERAQQGGSFEQIAPCYADLVKLLGQMRAVKRPKFPGNPKRAASWLKIRTSWTDEVIRATRAWAAHLAKLWLSAQFVEVLTPAGFPKAQAYAQNGLRSMVSAFATPYERELDRGLLPAGNRAALLRDFGAACGNFCDQGSYSVEDVRRLQELGRRVGLLMELHAELGRFLLEFHPIIPTQPAAFYEALCAYAGRVDSPESEKGRVLLQLATAWDPAAEPGLAARLRQQLLARAFAMRLGTISQDAAFSRCCYDQFCEQPATLQALRALLGKLIDASVSDPAVMQKLDYLAAALEAWSQDLCRIKMALPEGVMLAWPIKRMLALVQCEREEYEQTRLRLDEAALRVLPNVLGSFRSKDSDFTLICGERQYPVHRVVLARLGRHGNGLLSGLLHYQKRSFELPSGDASSGKLAPKFTELLVGCLLHFIYHGSVPDLVAKEHATQLSHAFAYLFPELEGKSWQELSQPGPDAWFDQDLLDRLGDCSIPCVDRDYRFYKAVLRSLPGALGNVRDLTIYRFSHHELDMLLHAALGDVAGLKMGPSSREAFLKIDPMGNWLLGEELWQARRQELAERCL